MVNNDKYNKSFKQRLIAKLSDDVESEEVEAEGENKDEDSLRPEGEVEFEDKPQPVKKRNDLQNDNIDVSRETAKPHSDKDKTRDKRKFRFVRYLLFIPGLAVGVVLVVIAAQNLLVDKEYMYIGPLKSYEKLSLNNIDYKKTVEPAEHEFSMRELARCKKKSSSSPLEIKAEAYMAFFTEDFQIVAEKDINTKTSFASIAKLLGALTVLEDYDLAEEIALIEQVNSEGNGLDLQVGEEISVENLLAGALVGSRNDAMYALAQNYPGGVDEFVAAMNEKAAVLGMENTHVANPIGLDDPDQYSTPRDIAILAIAAMKKDPIRDLVSRKSYMVETVSGRNISVENTNPLVGELSGVIGLKTGYTGQAGLCLVTYVDDNPDLIVIVLNAEDRGEASKNLINWVRDNYTCESY
jgi:hypothetical protein